MPFMTFSASVKVAASQALQYQRYHAVRRVSITSRLIKIIFSLFTVVVTFPMPSAATPQPDAVGLSDCAFTFLTAAEFPVAAFQDGQGLPLDFSADLAFRCISCFQTAGHFRLPPHRTSFHRFIRHACRHRRQPANTVAPSVRFSPYVTPAALLTPVTVSKHCAG